jgi:hypothetical protein
VIDALLSEVSQARQRALGAVAHMSAEQSSAKPGPVDWSVNEILEHLVLAEQSGVSKIWAAADGFRCGKPVWSGDHTNKGLEIDEVIARTWKEKEVAPPIATPHIGGPKEYWMECLQSCQPLLVKLGSRLDGLDLEEVIFPHFISGPLDAKQRLQFLRFHIDRHIVQIKRIETSEAFKNAKPI